MRSVIFFLIAIFFVCASPTQTHAQNSNGTSAVQPERRNPLRNPFRFSWHRSPGATDFILDVPFKPRLNFAFISDLHANTDMAVNAMEQAILDHEVDYIIINGDITHHGPKGLIATLKIAVRAFAERFTREAAAKGVSLSRAQAEEEAKKHILTRPGNREYRNGMSPEIANRILSANSTVMTYSDVDPVNLIIRINNPSSSQNPGPVDVRKIWVSHFLTHRPETTSARKDAVWKGFNEWYKSINYDNLRYPHRWIPALRLPSTFNQMTRGLYPDVDVEIANFQHTHKTAIIPMEVEGDDSKRIVGFNTGAISSEEGNNSIDRNRYSGQPYGYAIYSIKAKKPGGILRIFDANLPGEVLDEQRVDPTNQPPIKCRRITERTAHHFDRAESQNGDTTP